MFSGRTEFFAGTSEFIVGTACANRVRCNRSDVAKSEMSVYRGFTSLLPSNGTFAVDRAATVQLARDLYGAGSTVERAVTQHSQ